MLFGNKLTKIDKMVEKNQAEKLHALLNDKDETVVLKAIEGLGKCTGDVAFNALVPLVHYDNAKIRAQAISALGVMGQPKSRAFLLHQREAEKDPAVLKAIDEALTHISVKV